MGQMKPLTFAQRVKWEGCKIIALFRGNRASGKRFFAYLEIEQNVYMDLVRKPNSFKEPADHGNVILEGEGDPTEAQRKYMEDIYGFDHSGVNW